MFSIFFGGGGGGDFLPTIGRHFQGSSQRCSPCPSKGNDGEQQHRHHEAFESGNARDVYSSVSHLKGNLDSLSFAIGLREEGGREGALERLLPMLKIRPRPNEVCVYVSGAKK